MKLILPAILLTLLVLAWWIRRSSSPRLGEIGPASVLQKKYGLYAENRPTIKLNPQVVPENLRDLIPMAEKWGIGDDIIRGDFEDKASPAERDEFERQMTGRTAQVQAWLDSPEIKNAFESMINSPLSEAAAAFMYMTTALDEMDLWPDPVE